MNKIGRQVIRSAFSTSKLFMDLEAQYGCHNYAPLEVVIAKGEGVHMWDCEGDFPLIQAKDTSISFQLIHQ